MRPSSRVTDISFQPYAEGSLEPVRRLHRHGGESPARRSSRSAPTGAEINRGL